MSKANFIALVSSACVVVLVLMLMCLPRQALAKTPDVQFKQYLWDLCNYAGPIPAQWNVNELSAMCQSAFPGGFAGSGTTFPAASNVGTVNAGSGTAMRKKKGLRESVEEQKGKSTQGASADGGGWGFLVTPQYGQTTRTDTDLENGYRSELAGLVAGVDYRFSDSFVLGGALGHTRDNAVFVNNAGSLKTGSNAFTLYGTWVLSESTSLDGYLGYSRLSTDSRRFVDFGNISGLITGGTSGRQTMAGMSLSHQSEAGRYSFAPFLNLDFIRTRFSGYSESGTVVPDLANGGINKGTSLLALRYADRSVISFTSSLGARLGASYNHGWGTLALNGRLAAVHEFQHRARQLTNELVNSPGFSMAVTTDALDCNYLIGGLGAVAALNGGNQLFLDFEKRAQDRLLSNWAVNLGALFEF